MHRSRVSDVSGFTVRNPSDISKRLNLFIIRLQVSRNRGIDKVTSKVLKYVYLIDCLVRPSISQLLRTIARLEIAKKYQIQEDAMHAFCVTCCCPCCADGQVQNEIMVQMNLKHSCACVVPEQMER